ncbi:MAG: hypothetical protein IKT46_05575 [Clostridia bacterium]|nr:hypothetical protein [Clostridia bacterium]
MKKIIALLLTLVLALSIVACSAKTTVDENPVETEEQTPVVEDLTVAQTLAAEFKTLADGTKTAQELADALLANEVLTDVGMMATMPIEDVYLAGFDNYEVNGFDECVMFAPMIGAIPFVGYVFTLTDGVDASAFAADLEANANLRWNICVTADEAVTAVEGNQVMFVMSRMSFEQEQSDDMAQDEAVGEMEEAVGEVEDIVGEMDDVEVPAAFDGEMAE